MSESKPVSIEEALKRVDQLLNANSPRTIDGQGTALGIKLALIMGREIRDAQPLGSESATIIAKWVEEYGQAQTESAIQMARQLMLQPGLLEKELELRLVR